jgi:hypothetical protein
MFDVTDIVEMMRGRTPKERTFEPTDVQLSDSTVSIGKAAEDAAGFVSFRDDTHPPINSIHPDYPLERRVIAIDSTSVVLGYVPEGLVGAIRASVILKPEGKTQHAMERYPRTWLSSPTTTKTNCTPTRVSASMGSQPPRRPQM